MHKKVNDLRVLVLAHEPSLLQFLQESLDRYGIQEYYLTTTYQQASSCYNTHFPDICMFSVELMDGTKSGIDLAKSIRERHSSVPIIFLSSAATQRTYRLIQSLHPSNLITKEDSELQFFNALNTAVTQLENSVLRKMSNHTDGFLLEKSSATDTLNRIFLKIGDSFKGISCQNIDYFFAEDGFTYARTKSNRRYPTTVQLKTLEEQLNPTFMRCHRKYLVNVDSIESILTKDNKIQIGEEIVPIGHHYQKSFFNSLMMLK